MTTAWFSKKQRSNKYFREHIRAVEVFKFKEKTKNKFKLEWAKNSSQPF